MDALPWVIVFWLGAHGACGSYDEANGSIAEVAAAEDDGGANKEQRTA